LRLQKVLTIKKPLGIIGMIFGIGILISFFALAWEPISSLHTPQTLYLGPHALSAGWNRVEIDQSFTLQNTTQKDIRYEILRLNLEETLKATSSAEIQFPDPGIYQIRTPDNTWRSAFISIEEGGYPIK
ncbi:MAG: hypothetical protein U1C97_02820, partial [Candidatus Gracilibacteria bacterium]|nr:hypothetical protein [Candidatus Gracilibacteria bacterium]